MATIFLHHGLFGTDEHRIGPIRRSYFHKIDAALRQRGHTVFSTRVHPTAGVETRARQLKQQVLARLEDIDRYDERVLIIAHSMGGLDARYMVTKLGMARHVATILTVSAPHRGSPYADWIERNLGQRLGILPIVRKLGWDITSGIDLTTAQCARFNEEVPDHPDVRYASISCSRPLRQMPPFAMHSHAIVGWAEGDNDGLVSTTSARWGEYLGNWPLDHWQSINRRFSLVHSNEDVSARYVELVERVT